MYKRDFDCPPGEGVPCTPVTTLEKMILESPCGEDSFTGCVPKLVNMYSSPSCKKAYSTDSEPFQRRIWLAPKDGCSTYIYFHKEMLCEEQ